MSATSRRSGTAILPHMTLLRDLGLQRTSSMPTRRAVRRAISSRRSRAARRLADGEWADYGRRLTALAERMADFGVGMAFHHHMGTIVETDPEVDRLMASTGEAVGLLYDTGHCLFSGGDPEQLLRRHVGRIVHVHCKDCRRDLLDRARASDESFMQAVLDGVFTVPGDGFVDYPTLLRILRDAGYAGLARLRGGAGPGQGASPHLRDDGLHQPASVRGGSRLHCEWLTASTRGETTFWG